MRELNDAGELIDMFNNADKMKTKLKYLIKKSKVTLYLQNFVQLMKGEVTCTHNALYVAPRARI